MKNIHRQIVRTELLDDHAASDFISKIEMCFANDLKSFDYTESNGTVSRYNLKILDDVSEIPEITNNLEDSSNLYVFLINEEDYCTVLKQLDFNKTSSLEFIMKNSGDQSKKLNGGNEKKKEEASSQAVEEKTENDEAKKMHDIAMVSNVEDLPEVRIAILDTEDQNNRTPDELSSPTVKTPDNSLKKVNNQDSEAESTSIDITSPSESEANSPAMVSSTMTNGAEISPIFLASLQENTPVEPRKYKGDQSIMGSTQNNEKASNTQSQDNLSIKTKTGNNKNESNEVFPAKASHESFEEPGSIFIFNNYPSEKRMSSKSLNTGNDRIPKVQPLRTSSTSHTEDYSTIYNSSPINTSSSVDGTISNFTRASARNGASLENECRNQDKVKRKDSESLTNLNSSSSFPNSESSIDLESENTNRKTVNVDLNKNMQSYDTDNTDSVCVSNSLNKNSRQDESVVINISIPDYSEIKISLNKAKDDESGKKKTNTEDRPENLNTQVEDNRASQRPKEDKEKTEKGRVKEKIVYFERIFKSEN